MNAIGYARCSTQEQADSGLGIKAQVERIKAYCLLKGLNLLEVVTDEGISGGKPLATRLGGQRLLSVIPQRQIQAMVILRLDRMFRNASDCLVTIEKWEKANVALHLVDFGGNAIDTTSAAGRFMLVVLAGAAEMEKNLIRDRTRQALAVKKANNQRVSRTVFGYDISSDGKNLIENPVEQAIIASIISWRREGLSYPQIAQLLTSQHIPTKSGNTQWNQSTIRGIVMRYKERHNEENRKVA